MIKYYSLLITISFFTNLYGILGCISNDKETNKCNGYDYKSYHYVVCHCNCESYPQLKDRNQCIRCLHYHACPPI